MGIVWTFDMDEALRHGLERGEPVTLVCEDIGVAEGTARKRMRQLGLAPKPRPSKRKPVGDKRPCQELAFADLLAEGWPVNDAARKLGYTSGNSVLQRIRAKLGWQAV